MSFNEVNQFKLEIIKNDELLHHTFKKTSCELISIITSNLFVTTKDTYSKSYNKDEEKILKRQALLEKKKKQKIFEQKVSDFSNKHKIDINKSLKFVNNFKYNENFKKQVNYFLLEEIF